MNNIIKKINFKIVITVYLLLLICSFLIGTYYIYKNYNNEIKTIYNYHQLNELFEKKYDSETVKSRIDKLNKISNNIIDISIINNNQIVYSTNNIYKNDLTNIGNTKKYYIDSSNNIYKLENQENFMLDLLNIRTKEDNYYESFQINFNKETSYILNYIKNKKTDDKIIIISKTDYNKNTEKDIKIALAILLLFFMLYWVIVTLMIYQNALKTKQNAYLWGIITLFTNIIGVITYIIYIKNIKVCKKCHKNIFKNDKYCKSCGEKL